MSLLIVPLVYRNNVDRLPDFVKVLQRIGGLQNHQVLFCAAPSCLAQAQEHAASLHGMAQMVDVAQVAVEPIGQRTWMRNAMVQETERILSKRQIPLPWLPLELSAMPLRPDCWDKLEVEYRQAGKAFMGCILQASPTEQFMVMGIWPPNLMKSAPGAFGLLTVVNKNYRPDAKNEPGKPGVEPAPVEVYLGGEICGKMEAAHTKKIAYVTGGKNFRIENGALVAETIGSELRVSDEALLVGGCTDSSLATLLLGGELAMGRRAPAEDQPSSGVIPEDLYRCLQAQEDRIVSRLEKIMLDLLHHTQAPEKVPHGTPDANLDAPEGVAGPEGHDSPIESRMPSDIQGRHALLACHKMLETQPDGIPLSEAVALVEPRLPQPMLRALIKQPGSGLVVEEKTVKLAAA